MVSGVRYSLFLCDTNGSTLPVTSTVGRNMMPVDLQYLVEPALSQFAFFQLAHPFVESKTDAELASLVRDYVSFMASKDLDVHFAPTLALEIVWRTHLLHPMNYATDTAELTRGKSVDHCVIGHSYALQPPFAPHSNQTRHLRSWPSIDLVAAMRRQQGFMDCILSQQAVIGNNRSISRAVDSYRNFLQLVRQCPVGLEPTPMVDLIWHTHQ